MNSCLQKTQIWPLSAMDYYQQQSSPLCNSESDWYIHPATSYAQEEGTKLMSDDFGNMPLASGPMSAYSPDFQEVPFSNPGPIRRTTRERPFSRASAATPVDGRSNNPKVGRPPKNGSTTKMASYARSYRAHKKEEVKKLLDENNDLWEENEQLKTQNKALQLHLRNLEKEMMSLRSVMNKDSQIAAIVASLGGGGPNPNPSEGGVCLHLSGGRVQIEVCQTCNQRVRDRAMACRQKMEDPLLGQQNTESLADFY